MAGVWTICRRELAGLFLGPLAWVLLCLALFLNGFYFTLYLGLSQGDVDGSLSLALGGSWLYWGILLLFPPLLTMRMISEEAKSGVLEFLLTAPVSDFAVVCGKLLAATAFLSLLWASALLYAGLLALLGAPPDWGALGVGFLGSVLASAFFCGIGLVASAGTQTPLLAAFLAFIASIALFSLPLVADFLGSPPDGALRAALAHFDVIAHFQGSFLRGVLDSASVVFFVVWTAFLLFLATRLLETRRWR